MIRTLGLDGKHCRMAEDTAAIEDLSSAIWIDLREPTGDEERAVEAVLGIGIPTREEMAEIEASSRLYTLRGAAVMTTPVLIRSGGIYPETTDVTFVLTRRHLVTVRYAETPSLADLAATAERTPEICRRPERTFVALVDAISDRLADVLEQAGRNLDALGRATFTAKPAPGDMHESMQQLGRNGEIVSKARESLVGLSRLAGFANNLEIIRADEDLRENLQLVARDTEVLLEHAASLAGKATFLLDAHLGMINIEQNAIIKTFSVVAVVFLPPTLIASIYGMNFEVMPELGWPFGYPLALLAMIGSMIAPYAYFKKKGWI